MAHKTSSKSPHGEGALTAGSSAKPYTDTMADSYFQFDKGLNLHSRPKRQRKKVSYTEPDPNNIPVLYVQPNAASKTSKASKSAKHSKSIKSTKSAKSSKANAASTVHSVVTENAAKAVQKMERFVEMRWVQCDKCLKWRRIPTSISDQELSGEWTCSMNKWDLKRNSCSAPEEAYDLAEEQTVEVTNGESGTQNEKRKAFYEELGGFYASKEMAWKGLNVQQLEEAKVGDKAIDFLQLYLEITRRGGYHFCVGHKLFDEVFACLQCFQANMVKEASRKLQNLYAKYLNDYEQRQYSKGQSGKT